MSLIVTKGDDELEVATAADLEAAIADGYVHPELPVSGDDPRAAASGGDELDAALVEVEDLKRELASVKQALNAADTPSDALKKARTAAKEQKERADRAESSVAELRQELDQATAPPASTPPAPEA